MYTNFDVFGLECYKYFIEGIHICVAQCPRYSQLFVLQEEYEKS